MNNLLKQQLDRDRKKPDILTCIANLSNDEVFTPPELVDKILDLLPDKVWCDSSLRWLDPACKTGVFLRQIATRLMEGLRNDFPDEEERRQHIFRNMLFGIAITDLTALMSRRSLYTSKSANSDKSVVRFDAVEGNISYDNRPHTYKNGSCIYCGNKEGGKLDREDTKERHAYNFIHLTEEEAKNMKFDIIVGNPPYQLDSGGHGAQATPIYHLFVEQAKRLSPRYMAFIIPSRWFAGGMGLNRFRQEMLNDTHIKTIVDYPNAGDCFPGVEIKGGVNYFIWDKEYSGKCTIETIIDGESASKMERSLNEYDTFIRWNEAISILKKIRARNEETMDSQVSGMSPFGLATNFDKIDQVNNPDKIKIYANKRRGFTLRSLVQKKKDLVDKYKVIIAEASSGSSVFPDLVLGRPIITEPPSCCTMTYIILGSYGDRQKAENLANYVKTRFFRFLVLLRKSSHHVSKDTYAFVPLLNMNQEWTDKKLYDRYELNRKEIDFIEKMIKEMD